MRNERHLTQSVKVFFTIFAFEIIGIFTVFWVVKVFGTLLSEDMIVAFSGAFFAFLFLRLADWLNAFYLRNKKHFDGLVKLEHSLVELGSVLNDDLYVIRNLREATKQEVVNWSNAHTLPISTDYKKALLDLELMNQALSFYDSVRKYNDDLGTLEESRLELRGSLLNGNMLPDFYFKRMAELSEQMAKPLEVSSLTLQEELIEVSAAVRLRIRSDRSIFTKTLSFFASRRKKLDGEELKKEKVRIKNEIKESILRSRKEIERAQEMMKDLP